jgi:hypothetical protein
MPVSILVEKVRDLLGRALVVGVTYGAFVADGFVSALD